MEALERLPDNIRKRELEEEAELNTLGVNTTKIESEKGPELTLDSESACKLSDTGTISRFI